MGWLFSLGRILDQRRPIVTVESAIVIFSAWIHEANISSLQVAMVCALLGLYIRFLSFYWEPNAEGHAIEKRVGGIYNHVRYPFALSMVLFVLSSAILTRSSTFMFVALLIILSIVLYLKARRKVNDMHNDRHFLLPQLVPAFFRCQKSKPLKLSKAKFRNALNRGYLDASMFLFLLIALQGLLSVRRELSPNQFFIPAILTAVFIGRMIYFYRSENWNLNYGKRIFKKSR